MERWVEGKVVAHKVWTPGLFSIYVKAPMEPFIAGQFAQVALESDKNKIFRPYSIASSPSEEALEFYYNLVPEGAFTPHLAKLEVGAPVFIGRKPAGRFILQDVPSSTHIWLVATGTGLGPFLAILKMPDIWQRFENVMLVHSVRTGDWLTHQDVMKSLQAQYGQRFRYIPVVTREKWDGAHEHRILELFKRGALEITENAQWMLCGNPEMVKEMTLYLQERNFKLNRLREPGHITVENYWK